MIELILYHDGRNWIAENEEFSASGKTLEALDAMVMECVKAHLRYNGTGEQHVMMRFDNSTIPGWIRQYMPHYFNRRISVLT